jgi:hypothetical protein
MSAYLRLQPTIRFRRLTQHSSKEAVRTANALAFRAMTTSRLASFQKASDHVTKPTLRPSSTSPSEEFPTVPVCSVSDSGIGETERINTTELKRYFGCRKFANWKFLEATGTGIKVINDREGPSTVGDFATIRPNKHGKLLDRPTRSLHTVGMYIGYGEGTSPGGFKYALTLVDYSTRHCWTYGLKTKTAESLIDALWSFRRHADPNPM